VHCTHLVGRLLARTEQREHPRCRSGKQIRRDADRSARPQRGNGAGVGDERAFTVETGPHTVPVMDGFRAKFTLSLFTIADRVGL